MVAQCNRLVFLSARAADRAELAVVKTLPIARGAVLRIIEPRDVSAHDHSEKGRQGTPLLQRGGEQARERWARAAAARAVFGGDQLLAGACVAPLDRGVGRGHAIDANAGAVSG